MLHERVCASPANHRAQHQAENYDVVGVPEDRNEVRYKIEIGRAHV